MKSSAESDSHHSHHHKRAKRSKQSNRTESGRPSSGHLTSETSGGGHSTTETSEKRESSREKVWVAPNLRVRIVDTAFKRGRYYNSKVRHLSHSLYAVVQCSSTLLKCVYTLVVLCFWAG